MSDQSKDTGLIFHQTRPISHRLRRYPHNQTMRRVQSMTGDTLNSGRRRTAYFVLTVLLISMIPLISTASADQGIPTELQAQDIQVEFDNVSETTTVTWRNIEQSGGDVDLFEELWYAKYHVYRSSSPITSSNVMALNPWHTVDACVKNPIGNDPWNTNPNKCRGSAGNHPGHSATFQVGAGTDGMFFYAVVTELGNGNMTTTLTVNASLVYEPVAELTTPIRSPYNIDAEFNPGTSSTTIQWINYNSVNPVLPEDGDDALIIHVWRTDYQVDRSNGENLLLTETPIAVLSSTTTEYEAVVPSMTNREVFYSVTYLLPNWTTDGLDYEDTRFLSNNAMDTAVLEDNTPPVNVDDTEAIFVSNQNGTGVTTISWSQILSEQGEQYLIYRHGEYFNSTNDPYAQLVGTIDESAHVNNMFTYNYIVPYNTYGDFSYCVVVVDQYGAYNTDINQQSCDLVYEDSDQNWVKEPTNVKAEFIGDGTTRVTWTDQVGVEGERYHIWRGGWRVQGSDFTANSSLIWMGSVPDGVEQFDVQLPPEISVSNTHYFVTSEALYNCVGCEEPVMYDELIQNWDGPVVEDTQAPSYARISDIMMLGDLKVVDIEWINSAQENGESYYLYRHLGDPFGDSEFAISNYTDEGWEFVEGPIAENSMSTMIRQIPVPDLVERDVWYAVIAQDSYGNINPTILPGAGANALLVSEDTQPPQIEFTIVDDENVPISQDSLVSGDYKLRIEVSETLSTEPMLNISTSNGGSLTGGSEAAMVLLSQNTNEPDKGPEYFYDFEISSSTIAGDLMISINLTDMSLNSVDREISDYEIDAKSPTIEIFSPTSQNDGSMYLYGEEIKVIAGAYDDVGIVSMQMRFVQNYGSELNPSLTEPWRDATGVTITEEGDWIMEMAFSAGNFDPGTHEVSVRATDVAGNQRISKVLFITDNCVHLENGSTACVYTNPVPEDPGVIYPELNATDPPYMIAWVAAGISLLAVLVSLLVISTATSGPKKKKDDDEDEDEDWMNEFIGTSAEPDMAAITGTAPQPQQQQVVVNEDDDPFSVNIVQPKRRRKKSKSDDEDDDDEDDEPKRKRPRKRRPAGRRKPAKRDRS